MTNLELQKLNVGNLSHEARSLYIFWLRPRAEQGLTAISLSEISVCLRNYSQVCPFNPTFAQCSLLLDELEHAGLVEKTASAISWNGAQVRLPLFEEQLQELPERPFNMHAGWRPGPSFPHVAMMSGLDNCTFTPQQLGAFISYWISKPEKRNQAAWERAFVQRLLRQREARTPARPATYGRQLPASSLRRPAAQGVRSAQPAQQNPFSHPHVITYGSNGIITHSAQVQPSRQRRVEPDSTDSGGFSPDDLSGSGRGI